ncbi:MAG: AAA family ATPase [Candidatus Promineifilaceae bacterium]
MDLFEQSRQRQIEKESPLANRMRPRTLDEYVGQSHIIGKGRLLRRAIEADQLSSVIFFGPPGTGKTTLANVIANTTKSHFLTLNAVLAGVKQMREAIADANERRNLYNQRTTLFVDEVHRWNKAQQDALLPHVERGTILLIGATTENPYFEVNKALVSRSRIFQLKPLAEDDLREIAYQAIQDKEHGYGHLNVVVHENALDHLVNIANGDARGVLNALELAIETTSADSNNQRIITLTVAEESIQRRAVLYDKDGDAHYDIISAFIKSLRGSDVDAALYWAARMLYAGEDARFIFRRMGIFASEDIGMADPTAISVVESCWKMFERIGMPEGRFPLSQAILHLATAPKSNTSFALFDAIKAVGKEQEHEVPNPLKDGKRDKEGFGHGVGYKYPHAYQDHWVAQQYLPVELQGRVFYQPSKQGYEAALGDKVARRREEQLAVLAASDDDFAEILTTSPKNKGREAWLQRVSSGTGATLGEIRDHIFQLAKMQRNHLILDMSADSGLLLWEAIRKAPEGGVWGIAQKRVEQLQGQAKRLPKLDRPTLASALNDVDIQFDRIIGYNPITRLHEKTGLIEQWRDFLLPNGKVIIAQTIPRLSQRIYDLVDWGENAEMRVGVVSAENTLWTNPDNLTTNWNSADLTQTLQQSGWQVTSNLQTFTEQRRLGRNMVARWFEPDNAYRLALEAQGVNADRVQPIYKRQLADQIVDWSIQVAFVTLSST